MLRTRLLSAAVFIPIAVGLMWLGGTLYAAALMTALAFCGWEFARLSLRAELRLNAFSVISGILALTSLQALQLHALLLPTLSLLLIGNLAVMLMRYSAEENAALRFGLNVAAALYIGGLGMHLLALRQLEHGNYWVILTVVSTGMGDVGAYFIGSWCGKHKLAPKLSPSKTWEGYFGGVMFAVLSGMALSALFMPIVRLLDGVLIGALVGTFAPLGDLGMSAFKRSAAVKDFSGIVPGHGGALDRFDTLLIGGTLGYYYVVWFALGTF
ncbi:MAG: phosphatidate cytidylyltransferase [Anaerolineae bacterium]|nr:phosphatidate cytidylyltransferase [Anaerolineae bacterium]